MYAKNWGGNSKAESKEWSDNLTHELEELNFKSMGGEFFVDSRARITFTLTDNGGEFVITLPNTDKARHDLPYCGIGYGLIEPRLMAMGIALSVRALAANEDDFPIILKWVELVKASL